MLFQVRLKFSDQSKDDHIIHLKGLPRFIEYADLNQPVARFHSDTNDISSADVSRKITFTLQPRSLWTDLPLYHEID